MRFNTDPKSMAEKPWMQFILSFKETWGEPHNFEDGLNLQMTKMAVIMFTTLRINKEIKQNFASAISLAVS